MNWTDQLNAPGEHTLMLRGEAGNLEAVLTIPSVLRKEYFAILGHPHSLQGGTMTNKVVTTMARAFKELGISSLRFNFRGVGQSEGSYDEGIGESKDMLFLASQWKKDNPHTHFLFAGFSFGSYVAYRAAAQFNHVMLVTIAPPVHHYNYLEFIPHPNPWLIIQGEEDEVVPASDVFEFAADSQPCVPVIHFPDTGHFFHGKLIDLRLHIMEFVQKYLDFTA